MKTLAWPRLLFTALAFAFLFGILAHAQGQGPRKLNWSETARVDWAKTHTATGCGCTGPADCTCPPGTCTCHACWVAAKAKAQPRTKRATDGGPDWYMGSDGLWWRDLPGGYVPGPYGLGLGGPMMMQPMGYGPMMGGAGGGACRGGS